MAEYFLNLIKPRVTEKATLMADKNVFVFEVKSEATKPLIIKEIQSIYKVTPRKVTIVNTPVKRINFRGKVGKKQAPKKAYVYLKPGDTINIS